MVYLEDASYQKAWSEREQEKVHVWRRSLEADTGLYNVDIYHECTHHCFARSENIDTIDYRSRIYGCRNSGVIHRCGQTVVDREHTCRVLRQNEFGGLICYFSTLQVQHDERPKLGDGDMSKTVNLYKHSHFSIDGRSFDKDISRYGAAQVLRRGDRQRRLPFAKETRELQLKKQVSTRSRGIDALYKRNQALLEGSEKQDPMKDLREWVATHRYLTTKDLIEAPSLRALQRIEEKKEKEKEKINTAVRTGKRRQSGQDIDVGHGLFVTRYSFTLIKRTVEDLLFNNKIRKLFNMPVTECSPDERKEEIVKYSNWCGRIFALATVERENDKKPPGARGRQRVSGNCARLSTLSITLASLYARAEGQTMEGNKVVLPSDHGLKKYLPEKCDLCWFGIDISLCRELIRQKKRPDKETIKYSLETLFSGRGALQQVMTNHAEGPEHLRRILTYG